MRANRWWLLLAATVLVGILGCGPRASLARPDAATPGFTLTNVRLLGATTNLLISDGKIAQVKAGATAGKEIDCSGLTVVPGLIDTHVHLGFYQPAEVLAGGLTTVRDLGWDPDLSFGWQTASADPSWGPNTLVVGQMLTAQGGYPFQAGWAPRRAAAVGTPEKVDELAARGARFIKVTLQPGAPMLGAKELRAVVDRAHQKGLKVTAHVSGLEELDKALECGVDELAHMVFDSSSIPDATISRMVKAGVVVVPTLRVNPSPARLSNLKRFAKAGGRVIFGTDKGNGGGPGIDIEELELMVKAGMEPKDVLFSATVGAADWLGLPDRGRITEGARADLLVVQGDPLNDWSVLARPVTVIREGRLIVQASSP